MRAPEFLLCAGLMLLSLGAARADMPRGDDPERLDEGLNRPGVATSIMIGRALVESGDAVAALPYYRSAWEADPGSRELGIRLAEVAVLARRADIAEDVLTSMHAADPADVEIGVRLARLKILLNRIDEADALASELHAEAPRDVDVLELRMDLQEGQREFEDALGTLEQLQEILGDRAELDTRRGALLSALGRDDEAEAAFRRALELDPRSGEASARLTDLLVGQGRQDELIEELQRLVDEDLAEPRQKAALADLYLGLGRLDDAAAVLLPMASAGELDRPGEMLLVQLLGDLDRAREALDLIDDIEAADPEGAPLHRLRGELLLDLHEYDAAEAQLSAALEADPDDNPARVSLLLVLTSRDAGVLDPRREDNEAFLGLLAIAADSADPRSLREQFLIGAMYRRLQRWEDAAAFLERAAALPGAGEQVFFELAVVQQESGRRQAAADTLERLLELAPDSPDYLNFYGYLLAEDGRELDRAQQMIERALESDPENGAYIDSLGWVYYQRGELEAALDQLIRAVNAVGDDPVVLEHLGDCLRDLGRLDEARRTYERARAAGAPEQRMRERLEGLDELEKGQAP